MNKIVLPSILVATVLIAGIFAFSPIEEVSTVHTTILGQTVELKTVRCAETVDMDAANDDGSFTLNLPAASSNMLIVDIQIESGAQPFDADDVLTIDELTVDSVTLGEANAVSLTNLLFDAAPEEGSIKDLMLSSDIGANDNFVIDVLGAPVTDTSDYTISFFYMAPSNDADAACDVNLE